MTLSPEGLEQVEVTPCKRNPQAFSTPLLEAFDAQDFIEENAHLSEDELERGLEYARHSHGILHTQAVKEAVSLCRSCPILRECADWVLSFEPENGKVYGVVAGLQPHERQRLRRRVEKMRKRKIEMRQAKEAKNAEQEAAE